jgi:hypothetical protein
MGLVQTTGKLQADSVVTSVTFNTWTGSNFTAGNTVILAMVLFTSGADVSGITISGTAAVKDKEKIDGGGTNRVQIWRASNVAGGNKNIVISGFPAGTYMTLSAEEWDNFTATPFDQSGTGGPTAGSTAPSATTVGATAQADEVSYACFCDYGGTNWTSSTPPTGYTETFEEPNGTLHEAGSAAYKVLTATSTETATFTTGAAMSWIAAIATYKLSTVTINNAIFYIKA